jgi:hypothetical protein
MRIPSVLAPAVEFVKHVRRRILYFGKSRYCPVCNRSSKGFASYGVFRREDARCFFCSSLERHRLVWLYLNRSTDLFDGKPKTVLHFAPEACFEQKLRRFFKKNYVTCDLYESNVDKNWDIMDIDCPDGVFDVIYCSHVLQHLPDDKKALRELWRVLRPNGWAIILVPANAEKTIEDPTVIDPQVRLQLYGHDDYFRRYGPDFVDRLREAGFQASIVDRPEVASQEDLTRMGLTAASGVIYFCRKSAVRSK